MSRKNHRSTAAARPAKAVARLTRRELIGMIVTIAVIVIAVAGVVILPDFLADLKDHIVHTNAEGIIRGLKDNWLISNISETSQKRYSHFADIEPAPGYTLSRVDSISDRNEQMIHFTKEGAAVEEYVVYSAKGSYLDMASIMQERAGVLMNEVFAKSDTTLTEVNGHGAAWLTVNGRIDDTLDDEGNEIEPEYDENGQPVYPQQYEFSAYCYVESPLENRSVLLTTSLFNGEANEFPSEEEVIQVLLSGAAQIKFK